jgi:hypothetical protein
MTATRRKYLIRGTVVFNFALLFLLAIPPINTPATMRAIRNSGFDPFLTIAIPTWLVGSTALTTIFFFYPLAVKSATCESEEVRLNGWFLLIWWIAAVLLVIYGLGLGAGG